MIRLTAPVPLASALLVASLALALVAPGAARAHATLASSTPAADSRAATAPTEVVLRFSGPVVAGPGSVQVFGPEGRVDRGEATPRRGEQLMQRVEVDGDGTYGVAYRVSSEDGHVITGAITFSVGDAAPGRGGAAEASRAAARVDPVLQSAFSVARFVEVVALLVAAGGGMFACIVAPQRAPRGVVTAIVVLLAAFAAGFVLTAATVGGAGIDGALSPVALAAAADTPFGLALGLRATVALIALGPALLLTRTADGLGRLPRAACALVFVGLAASLSITGHAVVTGPTWLRLPLDAVHVTAAAAWIGGLVQLWRVDLRDAASRAVVARFSRLAGASVATLVGTGVAITVLELGVAPAELVDSRYGRLVTAKLVLLVATLPLAGLNQRTLVPRLDSHPHDAPRMLRRYVLREVATLLLVAAVTVWLIATPQP